MRLSVAVRAYECGKRTDERVRCEWGTDEHRTYRYVGCSDALLCLRMLNGSSRRHGSRLPAAAGSGGSCSFLQFLVLGRGSRPLVLQLRTEAIAGRST